MKRLLLILALAFPASAQAQDEGTPVVGGGSFNTAPLLEPGRYADTVAAGETVYWKVKLQKGQILKAQATLDTSEIETDYSASDYQPGLAQLNYRMDIFSPIREQLSNENSPEYQASGTELQGNDGAGAKRGDVESPRALGFEQILVGEFSADKFPAPGEWYLAVSVADSASQPAEVPAELPLDLEVTVEGEPQASSADFTALLPTPTPSAEATPPGNLADPQIATYLGSSVADAGSPALTIALVAVLALLGGLGLGALAARVLPR